MTWPTGASFQQAVVDVLVAKAPRAADDVRAHVCACGGGLQQPVAARTGERDQVAGRRLVLAAPKYCTDNAAMVAGLGYHYLRRGWVPETGFQVSARLSQDLGRVPFAPGP